MPRRARPYVDVIAVCKRVESGALYLDERVPGWYVTVDPAVLNQWSHYSCVLGQLYGEYRLGLIALLNATQIARRRPVDLGFDTIETWDDLEVLNHAWRQEIIRRKDTNDNRE